MTLKKHICRYLKSHICRNRRKYEDKDFHVGIGKGLCWVKWLKNWGRARFYLLRNCSFLLYLPFDENVTKCQGHKDGGIYQNF